MRLLLIFLSTLLFGAFLLNSQTVFAADRCADASAVNDITCAQFKISLVQLDPVGNGNSIDGGQSAATSLLSKIAKLLLFIIPILGGISMIIAGYYYILSSGDSEKATQAKMIIKWNLIAILVAIFSYSIIRLAAGFLSGSIT